MTCSCCGHAGAGVRPIGEAFACAKAVCQARALTGGGAESGAAAPASSPLRVATVPALVDELLRFLRQLGYGASEVGYGEIAVERGRLEALLPRRLASALGIWRAVHRAEARILAGAGDEAGRALA